MPAKIICFLMLSHQKAMPESVQSECKDDLHLTKQLCFVFFFSFEPNSFFLKAIHQRFAFRILRKCSLVLWKQKVNFWSVTSGQK